MFVESTRVPADWLVHGTYGVNAVRNSVPRDAGVTVFPAVTVMDSTRDKRVARGGVPALEPNEFPALLVSPADAPIDQVSPGVRPFPADGRVPVLIRYATREKDTAKAERDASQTLRAVSWSLPKLFLTAEGESARSRAQVQIISLESLQFATLYEVSNDTIVTGGVLATFRVRDLFAIS